MAFSTEKVKGHLPVFRITALCDFVVKKSVSKTDLVVCEDEDDVRLLLLLPLLCAAALPQPVVGFRAVSTEPVQAEEKTEQSQSQSRRGGGGGGGSGSRRLHLYCKPNTDTKHKSGLWGM